MFALLLVIEKDSKSPNKFKILDTLNLKTSFSNNIRNNFGFMNFIEDKKYTEDQNCYSLFKMVESVFKEVMPMVASLILVHHLEENNL